MHQFIRYQTDFWAWTELFERFPYEMDFFGKIYLVKLDKRDSKTTSVVIL